MTDAERYAALRALYLHWYERTHDEYHFAMASYAGTRMSETVIPFSA